MTGPRPARRGLTGEDDANMLAMSEAEVQLSTARSQASKLIGAVHGASSYAAPTGAGLRR